MRLHWFLLCRPDPERIQKRIREEEEKKAMMEKEEK